MNLLVGNGCSRDILVEMEMDDKIVNLDDNIKDPQLCATFACDIYKHLRASEVSFAFLFCNNFHFKIFLPRLERFYCVQLELFA